MVTIDQVKKERKNQCPGKKVKEKMKTNGDHWPGQKREEKQCPGKKKVKNKKKTSGDQVSAEENRRLASMLLNFALSLKTDWKIELLG